jgi:hypothetical protein
MWDFCWKSQAIMSSDGLAYCLIFKWDHRLFSRTHFIYMTTSVSLRLNILCIMFKIIVVFIIMMLYVRVGILLACGKHLQDLISSHVFVLGVFCLHNRSIWYLITNNPNPNSNILLSTYPTPWPIWYLITCILTQLFNLYTYCEGKIPVLDRLIVEC